MDSQICENCMANMLVIILLLKIYLIYLAYSYGYNIQTDLSGNVIHVTCTDIIIMTIGFIVTDNIDPCDYNIIINSPKFQLTHG